MTEIDVSGCKNYSFKEFINFTECPDYCADYLDGICSSHSDCYYKQLKRLETENAKLKEVLEEIKKISKIAFAVCDDDCGNANKFMDIINKVSEVLKDE